MFGQDADFNDEAFVGRYNADLANDLGNLVSRATTMIHRYCGGVVPAANATLLAREPEVDLRRRIDALVSSVKAHANTFQLSFALREIWDVIGATNRYIVTREPWTLAKDAAKRDDLETSLYVAADTLRVVAELLRPFMPGSAERVLAMVGVVPAAQSWTTLATGELKAGTKIGDTSPLFPRIEQSVEELRKMAPDEQLPPAPAPAPVVPAAAPAAPAAAAAPADTRISFEDFMKVELRVAKVLTAERVPKSNKLIKITVDVGTEQRTLVAGIAEAYEPEALVGRTVVMVFNLKPAKLMGIESNGMILAGSPEGGKPELVAFVDPPPIGSRVR
jgi:methionyl-tRNA synthetase